MIFDVIMNTLAAEIGAAYRKRVCDLLERNLRLEAQIIALQQEREKSWPLPRLRRIVCAEDIAQMRALSQRGLSPEQIARRTQWSYPTVRKYIRGIADDRSDDH